MIKKSPGLKELMSDEKFIKMFNRPLTVNTFKRFIMNKQSKEFKPIYPVMEFPIKEFIEPNPKKKKTFLKRPFRIKKTKKDSNPLWEQVIT